MHSRAPTFAPHSRALLMGTRAPEEGVLPTEGALPTHLPEAHVCPAAQQACSARHKAALRHLSCKDTTHPTCCESTNPA